ncbi:MAG: 23S rRNA pseudouridylate synthase [Legionellales bacterium]|nr:23S rRNA pseudouridylate synthase [Legionellales bacterium]|tara:strand:+ start:369 stop:1343 length:975 start_codon:yes stop_codon:yes gene_type:complete
MSTQSYIHTVSKTHHLIRLDQYLKALHPNDSRTHIQSAIKSGHVCVDGQMIASPKFKVLEGHIIEFFEPSKLDTTTWQPQPMPLDILFEDDELCVINKTAHCVMHPGAGTPDHTLANAMLAYHPPAKDLDRAGLIHRLDQNTTGCCIIAKTQLAQQILTHDLSIRIIERTYLALVHGSIELPGHVNAAIGRHRTRRTLMSVSPSGRAACTHYRPIQRYPEHTLLELKLETGRTHQIRVHMKHMNHSIVGDRAYGQQRAPSKIYPSSVREALMNHPYQALHATRISFKHPIHQKTIMVETPPHAPFSTLLEILEPFITSNDEYDQ